MRIFVLLVLPLVLLSCKVRKESQKEKELVKIDSVYHSKSLHTYEKETTRKADTLIELKGNDKSVDTPIQPDDSFTFETEDVKVTGKINRQKNTIHHDLHIKDKKVPIKVDETVKERGTVAKKEDAAVSKKTTTVKKQAEKQSKADGKAMLVMGIGLSLLGVLIIAFIIFAIKRRIL